MREFFLWLDYACTIFLLGVGALLLYVVIT